MKPVAIIYHADESTAGLIEKAATRRGIPIQEVRPYRGEDLPDPKQFSAVVSLGGPQSAYQIDDHPYLQAEANYLGQVVRADQPLLAVCLGSQILARSAGGAAGPGDTGLEAGVIDILGGSGHEEFTGPYLSFHSDSITVPPGAEILARSDRYIQAWRLGSALAVQFHPELTAEDFEGVLQKEAEKLKQFGVDVDLLTEEARAYAGQTHKYGLPLIDRWFGSWANQMAPLCDFSWQGGQ